MIWTIVSKKEMEGYNIPPVFQYYREVVGRENISLAVVDEDDKLDFVREDDIILLRTASKRLVSTIMQKHVRTTAEKYSVYLQSSDKAQLSAYLDSKGILVPCQHTIDEVDDGKTYFVKPRFGSESFGITPQNICKTRKDVEFEVRILRELGYESVIEDFINGHDCTVACYYSPDDNDVKAHAIMVECDEVGGIQTYEGKFDYNEYCYALKDDIGKHVREVSKKVFELLNIKHHARIDYRVTLDGRAYLIDVNLLPGLGPSAHFSKCLLLTENISYADTIMNILKSATK